MTTPMGLNQNPDQSQQKGPAAFMTLSSTSFQPRPDAKSAHSGHRSIDTVQLLTVGIIHIQQFLTSNLLITQLESIKKETRAHT